jgi:hypothetical protein
MKKAIGSLPVWQFTLLLVAVLAVFTVAVNTYNKRQKTA